MVLHVSRPLKSFRHIAIADAFYFEAYLASTSDFCGMNAVKIDGHEYTAKRLFKMFPIFKDNFQTL